MSEIEMTSFDKMANAFDANNTITSKDLDDKLEEVKNELELIQSKKSAILNQTETLPEQLFMLDELKTMILAARTTLEKLAADIKIGSPVRTHEVYAELLSSLIGAFKELRELGTAIVNIKLKTTGNGENDGEESINNKKISLTSNQLLDMIEAAKSSSELNRIDAHFEITNIKDDTKKE